MLASEKNAKNNYMPQGDQQLMQIAWRFRNQSTII